MQCPYAPQNVKAAISHLINLRDIKINIASKLHTEHTCSEDVWKQIKIKNSGYEEEN